MAIEIINESFGTPDRATTSAQIAMLRALQQVDPNRLGSYTFDPPDVLPPRVIEFRRPTPPRGASMNPAVREILDLLGPIIAREVNVSALEQVVVQFESAHLLQNPIPAVVQNADTIFPDPLIRPYLVGFLTKHLTSFAPPPAASVDS